MEWDANLEKKAKREKKTIYDFGVSVDPKKSKKKEKRRESKDSEQHMVKWINIANNNNNAIAGFDNKSRRRWIRQKELCESKEKKWQWKWHHKPRYPYLYICFAVVILLFIFPCVTDCRIVDYRKRRCELNCKFFSSLSILAHFCVRLKDVRNVHHHRE